MCLHFHSPKLALIVAISTIAVTFAAPQPAFGQQNNEKVLTKQTIKRVQESIGKLGDKGYVPMDALVNSNGRRATFDIRMVRPVQEIRWFSNFEMDDDQFEKLFKEKRQEGFQVAWHDEYLIRNQLRHACIWHFDGTWQPLTTKELFDADAKPKPCPLGVLWSPDSRIPVDSDGHASFAELEARTLAFMKANQMPALSTAVSFDGKLVYEGAFGYKDHETKLGIKLGQPIRLGGLSQLITTVAVLQLVDRGKLKLNQPVYSLLGIEPLNKTSVDARSADVTVLHLLQETSGHDRSTVIEPGFQPTYLSSMFKQKGKLVTPQQAISFMMSQPLANAPGEKSLESSYSFFLLGRVIEKVSGQSYEDYVLKKIAKPLRMKSLTMSRTDPDKRSKFEVRNVYRPGTWRQQLDGVDQGKWVQIDDGGYHFELLDASEAWMATAGDLLRLASAIQASPSRLLSDQAKMILIAKPDHVLAKEVADKKPVLGWKGCSVFCQQTSKGISFYRHSKGANTSAGLVCHSSSSVSFCYVFNTNSTADGKSPKIGYDPVLRSESYRVHKLLKGAN